jgi:hypothetical protein
MADAVTTAGAWSGSPASVQLRGNARPTFSDFGVVEGSGSVRGSAYARVSDDSGSARAVTFFLDRNENGRWDSGIDTSLGTVFAAGGDGYHRLELQPDDSWPNHPRIVSDVVDDDGDWSEDRRGRFTSHYGTWTPAAPTLSNYRVDQDWAGSDGKRLTLSVDAVDNSAVRAVTFFYDYDDNGAWTPGVDDSIGTVPRSGSSNHYVLSAVTDFGGREHVRILADASDYDDSWAPTRGSAIAQNGNGFVSEFEAHPKSGTDVEFEMKYVFPRYFNRLPPSSASYFLFKDVNKNGQFESATDVVITSGTTAVDGQGKARLRPRLTLGSDFSTTNWYGTALVSTTSGDLASNIISPVRIAVSRSENANLPQITAMDSQVGSSGEFGAVGATYTLTGTWSAASGGRVLSFFFDRNLNGMWDAGTDVDLGGQAISGASGSFVKTGTVAAGMVGYGAFAAVVADVTTGSESWSQPVSDDVTQIFAAPTVQAATIASTTVAVGSTLNFDVSFGDDSGVRAGTGFIDVNGDGLFNGTDSQYASSTLSLISGTRTSGVMRISLATAGLGAGTYTVYLAVADFHHGESSSSGGVTNGLWSHRYAVQVTLV